MRQREGERGSCTMLSHQTARCCRITARCSTMHDVTVRSISCLHAARWVTAHWVTAHWVTASCDSAESQLSASQLSAESQLSARSQLTLRTLISESQHASQWHAVTACCDIMHIMHNHVTSDSTMLSSHHSMMQHDAWCDIALSQLLARSGLGLKSVGTLGSR